jgi:hypothetical protein
LDGLLAENDAETSMLCYLFFKQFQFTTTASYKTETEHKEELRVEHLILNRLY